MIVIQCINRHKYNYHYFFKNPFSYNSEDVENTNRKRQTLKYEQLIYDLAFLFFGHESDTVDHKSNNKYARP